MTNQGATKKIGIFGHVGNKNLGDEALIAAVIQNIRYRCPATEIYGFTINPEDTRNRHKIAAFPIRRISRTLWSGTQDVRPGTDVQEAGERPQLMTRAKAALKTVPQLFRFLKWIQRNFFFLHGSLEELGFLVRCYKNLRGINLLIIAGSHQLSDHVGGPWAFPYTLLKWSLMAKATKTKIAFLSVGAGPINSSLGKVFLKTALSLADYRSYRDEISKEEIEKIGVLGQNPVFPDLAYSLQVSRLMTKPNDSESSPVVGINPMPLFHPAYWHKVDAQLYARYVQELALFAEWIIRRGYKLFFFPTQLRADPPVINDIRLIIRTTGAASLERHIIDRPIFSFEDLVNEMSGMDIIVATRFHGILISYLLKKPVLGIAYHKKSEELMARVGQAEYALDINDLGVEVLKERFISLEAGREMTREKIAQRTPTFRLALETQYDRVFGLLEEESR